MKWIHPVFVHCLVAFTAVLEIKCRLRSCSYMLSMFTIKDRCSKWNIFYSVNDIILLCFNYYQTCYRIPRQNKRRYDQYECVQYVLSFNYGTNLSHETRDGLLQLLIKLLKWYELPLWCNYQCYHITSSSYQLSIPVSWTNRDSGSDIRVFFHIVWHCVVLQ